MRHGGQGSAGTGRRGGLCRQGPLQSEAPLGCAFCTARRGSRPRGRGRGPRLSCTRGIVYLLRIQCGINVFLRKSSAAWYRLAKYIMPQE